MTASCILLVVFSTRKMSASCRTRHPNLICACNVTCVRSTFYCEIVCTKSDASKEDAFSDACVNVANQYRLRGAIYKYGYILDLRFQKSRGHSSSQVLFGYLPCPSISLLIFYVLTKDFQEERLDSVLLPCRKVRIVEYIENRSDRRSTAGMVSWQRREACDAGKGD